MNIRRERILLIVSLIISLVSALWVYLIGFDAIPNSELVEYIVTSLLYIFGLISIRGIWKLALEQKISPKKEEE